MISWMEDVLPYRFTAMVRSSETEFIGNTIGG